MGCGPSSAQTPVNMMAEDPECQDDGDRIKYDKKTGKAIICDGGKDDDGQECDFFEVEEATGEQFMSVRPWIGQITEPTNHNPVNNDVPATTLSLEYVYGYRCSDSKQNCHWNENGDAVYMTAALGVILNHSRNTQKFFGGGEVENTAKNVANDQNHHTDDIMAIALCPQRKWAVSGQVGSKPTIFRWDACTGEKSLRIKIAKGARGINAISVNGEGMIAAADLHNEHQVYCYDGQGNCIFKEKGDTNKIHDVAWDAKSGSTRFATAGVKHIYFWDSSKPGGDKRKGLFSGHDMCSFYCVTWDNTGKCWTGGSNGSVYYWDDERKCEGTVKAHGNKQFVCAITYCNGKIWSGAKDGKVCCIDIVSKQVERTIEFGQGNIIRSISVDDNGCLLVGQRDGTITIVDQNDNKTDIMHSHSDGEVWGLETNNVEQVITSGDDNKVMHWDPLRHNWLKTWKVTDRKKKVVRGASTLSKLPDSQCSRAVAVSPKNDWLAVAGNDGQVSIRRMGNEDEVSHELTDAKEWIECMAFDLRGRMLAVGSHDNNIYIYDAENGFKLKGTLKAHNSYIMALDWSSDGTYIRSNCGAYELLFFTIDDCKQDPSGRSNTVDTAWTTSTCKFQWNTQGIYPSGTDGTHINSVDGDYTGRLIATGDDYGLVNLFNDPCIKGKPRSYRGHSEHVTKVLFAQDYLFSVGGYDQTLMQWKLHYP